MLTLVPGQRMMLTVERLKRLIGRNQTGESWAKIACDIGVPRATLGCWVRRYHSFGPDSIEDTIRIPSEPLLAAVERGGGLGFLVPGNRVAIPYGLPTPGGVQNEVIAVERTAAELAMYQRADDWLFEARQSGLIDYYVADEISCQILNTHPSLIYGSQWWDFPETHCVGIQSAKPRTEGRAA